MNDTDRKYYISQLAAISAHIDTLKACIDSIDQRINEITDDAWFDDDEFESQVDEFGLYEDEYKFGDAFGNLIDAYKYNDSDTDTWAMTKDEYEKYYQELYASDCGCYACQRYRNIMYDKYGLGWQEYKKD